jgi:hypothetical protein
MLPSRLTACVLFLALSAQAAERLQISVLEGEGAFNNIRRKLGRNLAVAVQTQDEQPVEGAQVTFTLPVDGPSGTFPGNQRVFETRTDARGKASTPVITPNDVEGRFNILVKVHTPAGDASRVIAQSNTAAGGLGEIKSGGGGKKFLVLLGLAGGVAGGVLVATRRGGGSGSSGAPPTPTTLTIGVVSVGGPR